MAKITWYGHSAVKVEIAGKTLIVDPMLDQNPNSPVKAKDVTSADVVYVTHDHPDHLGEAFNICKRTGAVFAAVSELAEKASKNGVKNTASLNVGGSYMAGGVKLTVVQAVHSAAEGTPTGVMIQGEGVIIYHAGDTALFSDMTLFGAQYSIDLACLPMGGNFTMDAIQATAAATMLKPKVVLPLHFKTFPVLAQSTAEFEKKMAAKNPDVTVLSLKPGGSYELSPKQMHVEA